MSTTSRIELLTKRMRVVRSFTESLFENLTDAEWFWSPPQYTTHLAWQVGHIAASEYSLCMSRVRGRKPADDSLISAAFIEAFKPGSTPIADPARNPPLDEIRRVFTAVHEQALTEASQLDEAEQARPLDSPHPRFQTKIEAIEFHPLHEMVHAGQIGMLRRLMGKPPLR